MNKIEVSKNVRSAIRHILIQDQFGTILSSGTGIVVKPDGTLITAKHVVETEIGIYQGQIMAKGLEAEQRVYQPMILGFGFDFNFSDLINSISIDLTILKPVNRLNDCDFIPLCADIAEVGTDVLIGGFPDDVNLPLNFLEKFNVDSPEMSNAKRKIDTHFKYFFRQLMFKHAMIGNVQKNSVK